jgi:hypothetical protein
MDDTDEDITSPDVHAIAEKSVENEESPIASASMAMASPQN